MVILSSGLKAQLRCRTLTSTLSATLLSLYRGSMKGFSPFTRRFCTGRNMRTNHATMQRSNHTDTPSPAFWNPTLSHRKAIDPSTAHKYCCRSCKHRSFHSVDGPCILLVLDTSASFNQPSFAINSTQERHTYIAMPSPISVSAVFLVVFVPQHDLCTVEIVQLHNSVMNEKLTELNIIMNDHSTLKPM